MSMPGAPIAIIIIHDALKSAPNLASNSFLPGSFEVLPSLLAPDLDVTRYSENYSSRRAEEDRKFL